MINKISLSSAAKRFIKKFKKQKPLQEKFKSALKEIQRDPYDVGIPKIGDLAGIYGYDIYYQGTNYEIAYTIEKDEDGNLILIILAGSRENFYSELKRYWRK